MRTTSLLCAAILTATLAAAQTSKPLSAFDQQLIDQQKQLLQATQNKNSAAVERAVADDFRVVKLTDDSAVVAYNLIVPGEHPRYRHMADTWARIDGQWKLKFR